MKWINAKQQVTVTIYDEEHEEHIDKKMTVEEMLDTYTNEGCSTIYSNPERKPGKWIPVSERLPEEPYGCLVTVEDEEPMTGQWFETILPYFVGWDGKQWNDAEGEQCPFEVIAWMPLPEEPYKAESEDKE